MGILKTVWRLMRGGLVRIGRVRGVSVYTHWSCLLIAGVLSVGGLEKPLVTFAALASYSGVLIVHECGHVALAQRKGCRVTSVDLYPLWGVTRYETPWSQLDVSAVAWGGVLAQALIGVPLTTWLIVVGYTRYEAANAALALLGPFSLAIAAFNLMPVHPLDGATAWKIVPGLIRRVRPDRRDRVGRRIRRRLDDVFTRGSRR